MPRFEVLISLRTRTNNTPNNSRPNASDSGAVGKCTWIPFVFTGSSTVRFFFFFRPPPTTLYRMHARAYIIAFNYADLREQRRCGGTHSIMCSAWHDEFRGWLMTLYSCGSIRLSNNLLIMGQSHARQHDVYYYNNNGPRRSRVGVSVRMVISYYVYTFQSRE